MATGSDNPPPHASSEDNTDEKKNIIKFILANTLFPLIFTGLLKIIPFPIPATFWIVLGGAILLLAANVYFFTVLPRFRIIIGFIALLNVAAFILLGMVSAFTATPVIVSLFLHGVFF